MPRPKTPAHPARPQRWDPKVALDGPTRRHSLMRFVILWANLTDGPEDNQRLAKFR
jgi:hypothetical protein